MSGEDNIQRYQIVSKRLAPLSFPPIFNYYACETIQKEIHDVCHALTVSACGHPLNRSFGKFEFP